MDRARAVVVGGGITGASVAYHLAKAGWRDTVLLEKDELTSGSTCHAAGLVTQFNPSPTMMRFRRYSIELYQELGVFEQVGGLRFASSHEQLKELQRGVSRARGIGLEVELVSADESARLMPAITKRSLYGAVWVPSDGHLDPHTATYALAGAARGLGATVLTQHRVTGFKLGGQGEVTAVETDGGRIEADVVVIAGGIWAAQVAAMAGAFIVSTPVDHQHAALLAVAGHELPHDMPCFRDPDNLIYGKSEAGGVVLGGYEADPVARWIDGVPADLADPGLAVRVGDLLRDHQLMEDASRRLASGGISWPERKLGASRRTLVARATGSGGDPTWPSASGARFARTTLRTETCGTTSPTIRRGAGPTDGVKTACSASPTARGASDSLSRYGTGAIQSSRSGSSA